jgi:ligand-binding sensor domain-containing protein/signal transduction histidine kinase/DNA-binding response OmpR family regulator
MRSLNVEQSLPCLFVAHNFYRQNLLPGKKNGVINLKEWGDFYKEETTLWLSIRKRDEFDMAVSMFHPNIFTFIPVDINAMFQTPLPFHSLSRKICFALLLSVLMLQGITQSMSFNHLTIEHGLTNNSVLSITQDGTGFLWFGTRQGVNRYDGSRLKHYVYHAKDSNTLYDNNVMSLYCDSRKTVWAGTSSGLNRYNEEKDFFERIPFASSPLNINCIYEDKKGTLWIGSSNGLYALINKQPNQLRIFRADKTNGIAGNNVRAVFEDHNGYLWIGSNNGLTRMIPQKNGYHFENFTHETGNPRSLSAVHVTTIAEDAKQQLWIGTQNSGINLFDESTGSFTRFGKTGNSVSGLINNNIRSITSTRKGMLWVGTQEGLSIIDPVTKNIQSFQNDPGNNKSLSQNSIYSLYEDANGSVWIGTYFGGANSTYPYSTTFSVLQNHATRSSLSNNVVSSIVEDAQHNLWMGTEGGGLNYYNRNTNQFTVYKNNLSDAASLGSNLVKVVMVDKEQNIWCGTHGGGLNVLDRKQNKFKRYLYKENDAASLRSEITSLMEDDNGRIWVASNLGFQLFSKKGTELRPLSFSTINGFVNGISARTFYKDPQGAVWIGGSPGLYVVNGNNMKELNSDSYINNITQDKKGNIWVALSYGGIAMYNSSNGKFIRYTEKDGLPNNNVISLLEDENGFFWLSTDNGLIKYSPVLKTAQTYTVSDGLAGNEFNYNSYLKDSRGEFFFGGYQGITSFFPATIETNSYVAPVVFTGLRLFNNAVAIGDEDELLDRNINQVKRVVFTHKQNVFTIEFALLNFIKSSKNKYAYKLEGFDNAWNDVTTTSATYTNLPSGTYTFWVKGANNDGVWSKPVSIQIKVLPPFWLTWWAYCIYILAFAAILFLVVRFFFLRELLKKEDELHQVKLNFFTNVSHEIRTHLTLIMAPVEKLLEKKEKDGFVHQQLTQVKSNADRLLKLVSELMDFRKAETNHLNLHIERHNLIPFLQDIYSNFQEISLAKHIHVSFIHDAEDVPVYFDKEQLEKVFFNLLANAFKFTPEGGRILLMVEQEDNKVNITVTDNGRGIAPEYLDKLFTNFFQVADHGLQNTGYGIGLALSKNIVELHKGAISVESEASVNGKVGRTVFTVTLLQGNRHFETGIYTEANTIVKSNEVEPAQVATLHQPTVTAEITLEKQFSILIAEDNPELRTLVKETFNDQYNVIVCEDGLQGWNTAVEQIPDLIISDVMMPEMDGFEFCEKIKTDERTSHIPVILLTAKSSQNDQVSGLETGADIYITKPFSTKILELNVRNLLAAREKLRQKFSQQIIAAPEATTTKETPAETFVNNVDKEFLTRVMQIVDEHLDDPDFGVDKLARKVTMSSPILYKKIKAVSNMSVNEFVKSLRLKKAAQLLQQTDMTVYEVAYSVGFNDRKYFSREFKKQFGKTPSEYAGMSEEE